MKYFTRDLIERYGSPDDAVARAAGEEWETVLERYEQRLRELEPELPEPVREFNGLRLHDADVCCMARRGDQFFMVLHKDVPPRDVVQLTYTLVEEPWIDPEALPAAGRSAVMQFLYDEFDVANEGGRKVYAQSILFSNGWELRLRFREVRVSLADPVFVPLMARQLSVRTPAAQPASELQRDAAPVHVQR